MSQVWKAIDRNTDQTVALKVLDLQKTLQFEARFRRIGPKPTEGQIAVTLKHPHIVTTREHGMTSHGEQYLVMDYLEGQTLSSFLDRQNDVLVSNRLRWMIQIGQAMGYLHQRQFIMRDLCPPNVIIDVDRNVKLIDFGLVVPNTPAFQAPGNRTGKINYMAPELLNRKKTDQRIDVFSFAVTCYQMCALEFPWPSGSSLEQCLQILSKPAIPLNTRVPQIDSGLSGVIMKGLEISLDKRWQTIDQMTAFLEDCQSKLGY